MGTRKVRSSAWFRGDFGASPVPVLLCSWLVLRPGILCHKTCIASDRTYRGPPLMNSFFRLALFILTSLIITGSASATTYYIAANGSDSNNGTSKSTPWLHAPGMPNCTGTCASTTPAAGDQFIFRGGDTWHYGSGTPLVGGTWKWTYSGKSGNPIYIGTDSTWFSGQSFARPVLNGDNALSNSFPSSCTYDDSNKTFVELNSVSYVTFDNFENTGRCWAGKISMSSVIYLPGTSHLVISNFYCHGWTATPGSYDNYYCILGTGAGNADYNQFVSDIFDGADSSRATSTTDPEIVNCQWTVLASPPNLCASGQGIYQAAYDVHSSIFRYMSNFMVTTNTHTLHDNVFEYLYDTYASGNQQHPNVDNQDANVTGQTVLFYNNIMRHTYVTEDIYLAVTTTAYIFNNVFYDNMNVPGFGIITNGCVRLNQVSNSTATTTAYISNNTFGDGNCQINFDHSNSPLTAWNGTAYFQNNHYIGYSSATLDSTYVCDTGLQCTIVDKGNEVFQTTAVANSQGYVAANNYAPTGNANSTVGAGGNLSGSCSTFSSDSALCSGTSDAVAEQSGNGGQVANYPAIAIIARPSSASWDVGAYQFGNGQQVPNPPTGLAAVVQ